MYQPPPVSTRPVKGILKKPSNPPPAPTKLKWDEDNLMITEAQKDSTMKVTEPKTPYIHYNAETDQVMTDLSGIEGIPALDQEEKFSLDRTPPPQSPTRRVSVSDDDWDDEAEEDEETKEKHRRFAAMRSQHYHMKEDIAKAKKLLAHENMDGDESEINDNEGKDLEDEEEEEEEEEEGDNTMNGPKA